MISQMVLSMLLIPPRDSSASTSSFPVLDTKPLASEVQTPFR